MYSLAKYLLFFTSYNDMKEILEDYEDFSKNDNILEKPKDIFKSLDKNFKTIVCINSLIFFNLFIFIVLKNKYYFNIKFILPIILSFITPFIIYKFLGKKLILISRLYNVNNKDKILSFTLSLFYLLLYIFYFTYIYFISLETININVVEIFYIVENIFNLLTILITIITFYCLLVKGIQYYKLFCFGYINTFMILQIDAVQNSLTTQQFLIKYLILVLVIAFINIGLSTIYFKFLNKKVK